MSGSCDASFPAIIACGRSGCFYPVAFAACARAFSRIARMGRTSMLPTLAGGIFEASWMLLH
jgi:hypothetical protein